MLSTVIAEIARILAELGAGFVSAGVAYEPHMPESLIK